MDIVLSAFNGGKIRWKAKESRFHKVESADLGVSALIAPLLDLQTHTEEAKDASEDESIAESGVGEVSGRKQSRGRESDSLLYDKGC